MHLLNSSAKQPNDIVLAALRDLKEFSNLETVVGFSGSESKSPSQLFGQPTV